MYLKLLFTKNSYDNMIIVKKEQGMLNQFTRFETLIGKENMAKLKEKRVAIFGLGGVGGHVCDALARSGIFNFTLIDNDKISITNINRQIIASFDTISQNKVDVMKEHILKINKEANIITINKLFLPNNKDEFDFASFDYVIDAIDTVTSKLELASICQELNIPLISSMGTGNKLNPLLLEVDDIYNTSICPLARVMRHELKKRNVKKLKVVYSKEKPINCFVDEKLEMKNNHPAPASSAFVPSVAGIIIASEVIKDLLEDKNERN